MTVSPTAKVAAVDVSKFFVPADTVHPPLRSVGVSIATERERQQNDRTLADG